MRKFRFIHFGNRFTIKPIISVPFQYPYGLNGKNTHAHKLTCTNLKKHSKWCILNLNPNQTTIDVHHTTLNTRTQKLNVDKKEPSIGMFGHFTMLTVHRDQQYYYPKYHFDHWIYRVKWLHLIWIRCKFKIKLLFALYNTFYIGILRLLEYFINMGLMKD